MTWCWHTLLVAFCATSIAAQASAPPFSIQERNGVSWLVKPSGEPFFQLGVCVVTMGASREKFDPDNPGYAAWQHYADSNRWAEATVKRLRSWGFNTIGGWSDFEMLKQRPEKDIFFAPVLHVGSTAGAPWWDMWDPKIIERMDSVAREQIVPVRDDPRVLGYYSDNEMGWWNATMFKMTLEQAPTSGQRGRLMQLLKRTYSTNWSALLRDFSVEGASSWEELQQKGMLYLQPNGEGIRVMREFLGILAQRYYSLVRDIIRKYDQRALILGERYQSFYYPEVALACGPYLDAASSNLNAPWNDGTFPRFFLDTLHALTGKPTIVSEFYMAAQDNRSGNKNNRGIFPVVATQKERAAGCRNTLVRLLQVPYVIGADWFQYYDEPMHGRGDGENFNFGLVDIYDRPYERLTAMIASVDPVAVKKRRAPKMEDASGGIPPAPENPLGQFEANLALKHWDRERGFVKPSSEFPMADLYLCWTSKALFCGLYSQDIVEEAFYRDKMVPKGHRAEWIINIEGLQESIRARIGAGMEPIVDNRAVRIENVSGVNIDVRNIAAIEIPASVFGKTRFRAGDAIDLSSTLVTHLKGYRTEWRGRFTLKK